MGGRHLPDRRRRWSTDAPSRPSTSDRAASSRSRSPRSPPTAACCCSACRAPPRPGSASTSPRPSAATRPCSSRARPARPRSRCATAGTTPACSPRARARRPWSRARCTGRCSTGGSCASRSSPACRRRSRTPSSRSCRRRSCRCPSSTPRWRPSPGFNLIATANDRDRGINEMSSALRRRFNTVVLPAAGHRRRRDGHRRPARRRARARPWPCRRSPPASDEIRRVVTIFRELRDGQTGRRTHQPEDPDAARCPRPRRSRSSPTAWPSPPTSATARLPPSDIAGGIVGAVVRDPMPRRGGVARVPRGGGARS